MNHTTTHTHSVTITRPNIRPTTSVLSSSVESSDYASDASSLATAKGYETPPSRVSSPIQQLPLQPEMNLPARPPVAAVPAPLNIRSNAQPRIQTDYDVPDLDRFSPPTPGVDNTPYIRFALEQLTFDEELMGRGRHSPEYFDAAPTPVPQAVYTQPRETVILPTPIILSSQPHEQHQQHQQPLPPSPPYQHPPQAHLPPQPSPQTQSQKQRQYPPRPFNFPRASSDYRRGRPGEVMLLPSEPPLERHQLGFVPTPLRLISLGPLVFLCLLMVAGLIFSNVYALANHGLYDYDTNTSARYFVFEYLPPLLGMIIIFWLFVVQAAIYRVMPYYAISKRVPNTKRDKILHTMPITPANFVLPDWRFFRLGEPLVGGILTVFWIMNWTIPLLSCLYGTQWFTDVGTPRFRWTPVQGLGWFIMVLYLILIFALIYCMLRFRKKNSALMWDPTSLADLIILFQRSNILPDYVQSETKQDMKTEMAPRYCRLGYWTTNQSPDFFYAVGESNQPFLELSASFERLNTNEKRESVRTSGDSQTEFRNSQASSFLRMLHSPWVRYRWCPWYLRDGAILAWIIAAILLLIAFLVISFVDRAVRRGFYALLPATTQTNGFSPANFLYSFLPSLLGMFLFLAWQPVDVYFRSVQSYANLSKPDGATARRSILLSYNAMLPGLVTVRALINGDVKVAYMSLISLIASTLPILAGGVFTALLYNSGSVRMTASIPGYIALCVFLTIYALSYLTIWPTRYRYLPHSVNTVAGNVSFLYASRLLKDSSIRNIRTKADFIARLDGRVGTALTGDGQGRRRQSEKNLDRESRYGFGIYTGTDGKEHLGIDRMHRPGSGEMLVTGGITGKRGR